MSATNTKPLRILIADDHALVRQRLTLLLDAHTDFQVVDQASCGQEACRLAKELHPDIVIMDVLMPGLDGASATRHIHETCSPVKVLALSAYEDEVYVRQLLAAGAAGYVYKRTATNELVKAVRVVAQGAMYLDSSISRRIWASLPGQSSTGVVDLLSQREVQILRLTARGLTHKEIADLMKVSVKSVEFYKAKATRILNLDSRVDVVRYAIAQGWFQDEDKMDRVS